MRKKSINCLKLKDDIQSQLMRERVGMSDKQRVALITDRVAKAQSPVARLWRIAASDEVLARVAEGRVFYGVDMAKV